MTLREALVRVGVDVSTGESKRECEVYLAVSQEAVSAAAVGAVASRGKQLRAGKWCTAAWS